MEVRILAPYWGSNHLPREEFMARVRDIATAGLLLDSDVAMGALLRERYAA